MSTRSYFDNHTITYIILLLLTWIGFFITDSKWNAGNWIQVGLIIGGLKFLGIYFQYMEIKHAHWLWKVLGVGFVGIIIGFILLFQS